VLGFRVWHGLVLIVIGALLSATTNLVTSTFSWTLLVTVIGLVVVQLTLSVWQGVRDQRDRRAARDASLGELRPALATGAAPVLWLTAPFSPAVLWARGELRGRLVDWCSERDATTGVVRVLIGPGGVGKSKVALAVADELPAGWAAGRCEKVDGLVDQIVTAGDPTLVIVDNADRVAGLDTLIEQAARHPTLVRILLLSRSLAAIRVQSVGARAQLSTVEELVPIGAASDRMRWFREAAVEYARKLRLPPPEVGSLPVGKDEDTPLVLLARALLAVLGRSEAPRLSLQEIASELVILEQQHWDIERGRMPAGCDVEVLAEAVTVLLMLPAASLSAAAELLRRVPQFAHGSSQETRIAVARWARRSYPPGPDHRLDLRPHLLADRLIVETLARSPELLLQDPSIAAVVVLARAYITFPDALSLLIDLLVADRVHLHVTIPIVLGTGAAGVDLDHALAELVANASPELAVIAPSISNDFPQLLCAVARLEVVRQRTLAEEQRDRYRIQLAQALWSYGGFLTAVGRVSDAVSVEYEAVWIARVLAEQDPDLHQPDLGVYLHNLGHTVRDLGWSRFASAIYAEAVYVYRGLVAYDLGRYGAELAGTLVGWGLSTWDLGRPRDALELMSEAVKTSRQLVEQDPDHQWLSLVLSLVSQAMMLRELGHINQALSTGEQALRIFRERAEQDAQQHIVDLARILLDVGLSLRKARRSKEALDPLREATNIFRELSGARESYLTDLARCLVSLGACLSDVGIFVDALIADREAVAVRRILAKRQPDRYLPDLGRALHDLAVNTRLVGKPDEALSLIREAVAMFRELAHQLPSRYRAELAFFLNNLGLNLLDVGLKDQALATMRETVTTYEELAEQEPDRFLPDLARSLRTLGLAQAREINSSESLATLTKSVKVWQRCSDRAPETHKESYRRARTELSKLLAQAGLNEKAIAVSLPRDPK
jgi:tetratricopeptide (TPR) repeat protein